MRPAGIRALLIVGAVLVALGGWRFAVGTWGDPANFWWLDVQAADAKIADIEENVAKTKAKMDPESLAAMSPQVRFAVETDFKSQTQLLGHARQWRETIVEQSALKQQRVGFFSMLLGVVFIGLAVRQAWRARAVGAVPVSQVS